MKVNKMGTQYTKNWYILNQLSSFDDDDDDDDDLLLLQDSELAEEGPGYT